MILRAIFPRRRIGWYLLRGALYGGGIGLGLALALLGLVNLMGDGGGDRLGMTRNEFYHLLPNIFGWVVLGVIGAFLWWVISRIIPASQAS